MFYACLFIAFEFGLNLLVFLQR